MNKFDKIIESVIVVESKFPFKTSADYSVEFAQTMERVIKLWFNDQDYFWDDVEPMLPVITKTDPELGKLLAAAFDSNSNGADTKKIEKRLKLHGKLLGLV